MARFIQLVGSELNSSVTDYDSLYRFSIEQPEAFWRAVWEFGEVRALVRGERVVEHWPEMPGTRWFPDARLNFAENLLRRNDDGTAIEFAGEGGLRRSLSWRELNDEVARIAAGLKAEGVQPGDRVAGYLPNLPETVVAMLAATSHRATEARNLLLRRPRRRLAAKRPAPSARAATKSAKSPTVSRAAGSDLTIFWLSLRNREQTTRRDQHLPYAPPEGA